MSPRLTAYLALTITSLIWSVGAVLIKYSLGYTTPVTFLFWRFSIVSLVFAPLIVCHLRQNRLKLSDLPLLAALGFMATTLTLGLLFWGMSLTSATEAIIINELAPILVILGGAWFLKEQITPLEKLGAGFAVFGSFLTIIQPIIKNHGGSLGLKGNFLVLLSVLVWVAYTLLARKYQKNGRCHPVALTGISFMVGWLTITPFFAAEKIMTGTVPWWFVNWQGWLGIVYMAILGSCVAYLTYNWGLSLIEASEATIFTYLQAVFAIPLALIWLKESIGPWIIIGSVLIIIGVILTEYKPPRRRSNKV